MSDPTATLALCKWLEDRLKQWKAEAKQQLGLLAGERKAAVVASQVIGHVSMAKGRKTAKVTSETALLAYVKANYPTEIEVEERVRPAFLKQLLDDAAKKGAFVDVDGVVIDGLIDVVEGAPYPIVKLSDDSDVTIAGLLARGALGVSGLKEIEQ
ncbi:DNA binding protein [Mycobacterium phage Whouxphf]|uniref:DNA binding protein n=1 Tax=Mycobacterium phage Whouxphf TaxID=2484216 RepID=A0A3G3M2D9_9CAUD|nr:DNA binding protein [Mycobacterium phage Whouxphf]AYR00417.1 DNA binding protein [Mycobacterium phage Whouxphf]